MKIYIPTSSLQMLADERWILTTVVASHAEPGFVEFQLSPEQPVSFFDEEKQVLPTKSLSASDLRKILSES